MSDISLESDTGHPGHLARLTQFPRAIVHRLVRAWHVRREQAIMSRLDEHTLADIGYRRGPMLDYVFDQDGYVWNPDFEQRGADRS